jgi:hypothetical protein
LLVNLVSSNRDGNNHFMSSSNGILGCMKSSYWCKHMEICTMYLLILYQNILRCIKNSPFDCMVQVLVNHGLTNETLSLWQRVVNWILSCKQTLTILMLHRLTHKLEHGFHTSSIFISSSQSYHIHDFKYMIWMQILNVYTCIFMAYTLE